jgi:short-subunit dehydrogenase
MEKIILTGASDGIGKALAIEFARRGHAIALLARRAEKLAEVKAACESAGSPQVLMMPVDVTDEAAFESALTQADESIGGATMFIANAGVTGRTSYEDDSWALAKACLQVNVMAAIHGLEFMKVRMLRRKNGTLVGVTSIAGSRGMPTAGAYSTSKAALSIHLETMRVDLRSRGLRVVDMAPGFIDTNMTKKNMGKMPMLMQPDRAARIFVDGILARKAFVVAPRPWRVIYPLLQSVPRGIFDYLATKMYARIRG